MKIFKLKVGSSKIYELNKNIFELQTKQKKPYYTFNNSNEQIQYAVCPACDNPIQIIGYTFIVNESEMRKQKEQLLQSNEYRWAQAIDDLILYKNILGEKNQLIADLYREKSELEETNKELDEVIKTQAKQIEELNAKLNPDKHVHSQDQGMYPTL